MNTKLQNKVKLVCHGQSSPDHTYNLLAPCIAGGFTEIFTGHWTGLLLKIKNMKNEPNLKTRKTIPTTYGRGVYAILHPKIKNETNPNEPNSLSGNVSMPETQFKSVERERHDGGTSQI